MDENYLNDQFFKEQLMQNYKKPYNFKKLENYTFTQHQKNASCGDTFDLYIKLDKGNKKIEDVSFYGEGCVISTASFSLFISKLKGMSIEDAKKLTEENIYDLIGLKITPSRLNCALLPLKAFKLGLEKYEKKN